ncbi:hypothetical protein CXF68_02915 [Tenacibaculum sp. Bg11-29]|nr:hypothetical protein CXF68_02915 [Tenacibaculum sp. Bg11-29]
MYHLKEINYIFLLIPFYYTRYLFSNFDDFQYCSFLKKVNKISSITKKRYECIKATSKKETCFVFFTRLGSGSLKSKSILPSQGIKSCCISP